ncbi:MAG: phage tail tip lysozyme [Bdellovibrionales bacterium]
MPTKAQIAHFKPIAVQAMELLLADFPEWKMLDAAACLGNLGYETAGMTKLQEVAPKVKGSRGGFGWAQWTGPRRIAFENYCIRNKLDMTSFKANYAWLFIELYSTESATIPAVAKANGLPEKTRVFEIKFERAGIKNYDSRIAWAEIARDAYIEAQAAGKVSPAVVSKIEKGNAMDVIKTALASKMLWGLVLMLAPTIGKIAGVEIGSDDVTGLQSAADLIVQGVGAALAVWSRVAASKKAPDKK